jgi:hypothetical protein
VSSKESLLYIPQTSQSPGLNIHVASMVGYQPIGLSVNADVVSSFQTEVNVIDGSEEVSVDVSSFMKERAINGYCLDVGKNLQVPPPPFFFFFHRIGSLFSVCFDICLYAYMLLLYIYKYTFYLYYRSLI